MAAPKDPIIIVPDLSGTGNLQAQNINVIVSGTEDTFRVRLGIPPSNAEPNVTIVAFGDKNSLEVEFINGSLGYTAKGDILSGIYSFSGVAVIRTTKYAGGYWLFDR